MKVTIANKNTGKTIEMKIYAFPVFENGYVRLVTEGDFIDIKKCTWLNLDNIGGIEYDREDEIPHQKQDKQA